MGHGVTSYSPGQSRISGYLLWRIAFVSLLVVAGAFGMFFRAGQRIVGRLGSSIRVRRAPQR
jgi:hypothetical protein